MNRLANWGAPIGNGGAARFNGMRPSSSWSQPISQTPSESRTTSDGEGNFETSAASNSDLSGFNIAKAPSPGPVGLAQRANMPGNPHTAVQPRQYPPEAPPVYPPGTGPQAGGPPRPMIPIPPTPPAATPHLPQQLNPAVGGWLQRFMGMRGRPMGMQAPNYVGEYMGGGLGNPGGGFAQGLSVGPGAYGYGYGSPNPAPGNPGSAAPPSMNMAQAQQAIFGPGGIGVPGLSTPPGFAGANIPAGINYAQAQNAIYGTPGGNLADLQSAYFG